MERATGDRVDEEDSIDHRSEECPDLEVDLMRFFSELYESRSEIESPMIERVCEESDRRANSFEITII